MTSTAIKWLEASCFINDWFCLFFFSNYVQMKSSTAIMFPSKIALSQEKSSNQNLVQDFLWNWLMLFSFTQNKCFCVHFTPCTASSVWITSDILSAFGVLTLCLCSYANFYNYLCVHYHGNVEQIELCAIV